jgi:tetratricopeptide (TPR) repeat protein
VLSVKGRLVKDQALAASGRQRKLYYAEAARAYARAAAIGGANYPLINAATLSLLAGQRRQSHTLARRILARRGSEDAETPYWHAATRAEAELLLGEVQAARESLREAIALAPQAFEDHASTLRQFGLILDELREGKEWLDSFRPPRSMHFAGHMALSTARGAIEHELRRKIIEERIGFGYGALAAGADILIAEALLEMHAELHLILPAAPSIFREASVARLNHSWAKRFDAILDRASSVRAIAAETAPLSALAITLAAEVAMGRAAMQADTLVTDAVQVLILDRKSGVRFAGSTSGSIARCWEQSGRRQHVLVVPRIRNRASPALARADGSERLTAMLRIDLSGQGGDAYSKHTLHRIAEVLATGGEFAVPPRWTGEAIIAAYQTPSAAAESALSVAAAMKSADDLRIAAHYGIARLRDDPFGAAPFLAGPAASLSAQIIMSTPGGAIHVSENFAAALCAGPAEGRPRVEHVGELASDGAGGPIRLYSLKR